jgi:hypothetical protein
MAGGRERAVGLYRQILRAAQKWSGPPEVRFGVRARLRGGGGACVRAVAREPGSQPRHAGRLPIAVDVQGGRLAWSLAPPGPSLTALPSPCSAQVLTPRRTPKKKERAYIESAAKEGFRATRGCSPAEAEAKVRGARSLLPVPPGRGGSGLARTLNCIGRP